MMRFLILILLASPVAAEIVVPARTIPAQALIGPEDLLLRDLDAPGSISDPELIIGMEARVALFSGRPIRPSDIMLPAVVSRNQIIPLIYSQSGIVISTDGRALDRAGPGEMIRVMNLASRSTVTARIGVDGVAYVAR